MQTAKRFGNRMSPALVATLLWCGSASDLFAQDEPQTPAGTDVPAAAVPDEAALEQELSTLWTLSLDQQRAVARRFVSQYPGTRIAARAQRYLDQLQAFDRLKAAERARDEAHKQLNREFWKARNVPPPPVVPNYLELANNTDESVQYQVRWRGVQWIGPYIMLRGTTHRFTQPVMIRQATPAGVTETPLPAGGKFQFVKPNPTAFPQLVPATPR